MIVEGIVTSIDTEGVLNVAAMGAVTEGDLQSFELRPFVSTATFENLQTNPQGVFHVIDDVEILVRAALNQFEQPPSTRPAEQVQGRILDCCCRWIEFTVESSHVSGPKSSLKCVVAGQGHRNDFGGFNRAKHAIIEAAIVASRLHIISAAEVDLLMNQYTTLVKKTAGPVEQRAFEIVTRFIEEQRNTK